MKINNSILIITNMFPTTSRMAWRQESCNVNESINADLNIKNSITVHNESLYHENEATGQDDVLSYFDFYEHTTTTTTATADLNNKVFAVYQRNRD